MRDFKTSNKLQKFANYCLNFPSFLGHFLLLNMFILDEDLTREHGFEVAGFYANLWGFCGYFNKKEKTNKVYQTMEQVEKNTGLTRKKQDTAIKKLEEIGLLKKTIKKIKGSTIREFELLKWDETQENIAIGKKYLLQKQQEEAGEKQARNVQKVELGMSEKNNPITIKLNKEIYQVNSDKEQKRQTIADIMKDNKYAYLFKKSLDKK